MIRSDVGLAGLEIMFLFIKFWREIYIFKLSMSLFVTVTFKNSLLRAFFKNIQLYLLGTGLFHI